MKNEQKDKTYQAALYLRLSNEKLNENQMLMMDIQSSLYKRKQMTKRCPRMLLLLLSRKAPKLLAGMNQCRQCPCPESIPMAPNRNSERGDLTWVIRT